jgi:hypothetical protein
MAKTKTVVSRSGADPHVRPRFQKKGMHMSRTNEELDEKIAEQETLIAEEAGMVDTHRGRVSKAYGQRVKNRAEAIRALESRKEATTVNLKAGI